MVSPARPEKTLRELAEIVGGKVLRGDPSTVVRRVMPTDQALEDAVTFVTKPKYLAKLAGTRAAAVMLAPEMIDKAEIPARTAVISVARPYVAFARAAQALAAQIPAPMGVHRAAVVEPGAELGADVAIGPFAYVAPGARVGDGAVLYAGVHVEAGASVGPGSVLYDHVVIRHGCTIGARCILHPGVVVGSDGFGFAEEGGKHVKIPQVGTVLVEDDVEIGANSCLDRGALGVTRIGAGTKIDNLVQIAHNVDIGPGCIIVAQAGIAGSSRIGRAVIIAAQAGVSGHLEVGEGATVLGQAGVIQDVPAGERYGGYPAMPEKAWFRAHVRNGQLDSLFKRVKKLESLVSPEGSEEE